MSPCRLYSRVQSLEGIALTFPTNCVERKLSPHNNHWIWKSLIQKTITYACTIDRTKCKFHWTSVWLHLFLFCSLGSTNQLQHIQEEQCYIMQVPMKSRQGFSARRKHTQPVTETLEQCNTKLHAFNTWTTTVDSSVWLAGNFVPTPLGQLFPTNQKQLGEGWAALGKAAQKGLISQGVQTLLPELEADLCLSGEIVLQRSNPLVLKLNEADPSELHQCFKFLKFYHSSVVIWSPLCATTLCIYLIRATSLWPQRKIPCSLLQISKFYGGLCLVLCIWCSVICHLLSSFWAGVNYCHTIFWSAHHPCFCLLTGLI